MRVVIVMVAAAVLALAACGKDDPKPPSSTRATPAPSPDTRLIAVEPQQLVLTEQEMIPGTWKVTDGAVATGQHTRRFERDQADPALAAGTIRVDIQARLHETVANAVDDFQQICTGTGGSAYVQSAIAPRGFTAAEMRISNPVLPDIGADEHWLWRVEYGKPGGEQFSTYYLCMRVRNSRTIVSTIAPMRDGAEPANLLAETIEAGKRQAQRLNDILQKMPPVPPGPRANATSTP